MKAGYARTPAALFIFVPAWNDAGESTASPQLTLNPAAAQKLTCTVVSGGTPLSPNTPGKVFDDNPTSRSEVE